MIQEIELQGGFIFERDGDTSQEVHYAHLTGGKIWRTVMIYGIVEFKETRQTTNFEQHRICYNISDNHGERYPILNGVSKRFQGNFSVMIGDS